MKEVAASAKLPFVNLFDVFALNLMDERAGPNSDHERHHLKPISATGRSVTCSSSS